MSNLSKGGVLVNPSLITIWSHLDEIHLYKGSSALAVRILIVWNEPFSPQQNKLIKLQRKFVLPLPDGATRHILNGMFKLCKWKLGLSAFGKKSFGIFSYILITFPEINSCGKDSSLSFFFLGIRIYN